MEQGHNNFPAQPEFLSFERRLMEVVHELNMKRRLLDECRLTIEGLVGKQHELERMVEVERRECQKMRMQLQVAMEAVQQCGDQRAAASPELSRLRIELEVAVRERDCLKDQTHSCQLENLTLHRQVEELQGQLRCQQMFQENSINMEAKIRTAVEEVKSEMQKLDQDHRRLEKICEVAEKMGTSLQEAHTRSHSMLKKTAEQQKKYESETFKYFQEIKEFVAAESKGSTQLTDTLQKALEAQSTFQKLEQEVREKLQEEMERVSVLQSSNIALNESLCEARETVRSLEQQVKELLAKPASEDQGTQTDTVASVHEECGMQTDVDRGFPDVDGKVITEAEIVLPEKSAMETTNDEKECEILQNVTDN